MRRLRFSVCMCLVFVFSAAGLLAGTGSASAPDASEFVPGEVIVGFEEITGEICEAVEAGGGSIVKEISVLEALVVKVAADEEDFIQRVHGIHGFRYAERNGIVEAAYTPSDTYWSYQWNMRIIEADKAWDIQKGSNSVVVAIVDTGVDYNHKDLAAHYVSGGYDWVNNDNYPRDDNSHGTHCAGIAAAVMDNNVGVVGVAQCGIWAEKVLDHTGYGDWTDLASGIIHATDNGVDVISMSLGGYDYSSLVDNACKYAWNKGVLLVAAAGNDNENIDLHKFYPASLDTVVAVSATTSSDVRWSGSNYGNTIEIAAPGAQVPSTIPGNSYGYLTGTSMACPHVAGVAALSWSHSQSLTNVQLRNRLHTAVDDLGNPGKDTYYGYGRVNAFKAFTGVPAFQYHFQLSPSTNMIHLNLNPGGWLNGYMTGGPTGWNPLLGKYEAGRFYMAIDVYPDGTSGYYETVFLAGTYATRTGQLIQTYDGMTYDGPHDFNLAAAAVQSEGLQGPDITQVLGSQVTPQASYTFLINPYTDIVHLNTNPGGWLNGYDETPTDEYPVLGFVEGDRFYFAIDSIDTPHTLAFVAGKVYTLDGDMIRTVDGTTINGPRYTWLTPV